MNIKYQVVEYGVLGFTKEKGWKVIPFGCKFSTKEAAQKRLDEYKSRVGSKVYEYKAYEDYKIAKHTVITTEWEDAE